MYHYLSIPYLYQHLYLTVIKKNLYKTFHSNYCPFYYSFNIFAMVFCFFFKSNKLYIIFFIVNKISTVTIGINTLCDINLERLGNRTTCEWNYYHISSIYVCIYIFTCLALFKYSWCCLCRKQAKIMARYVDNKMSVIR